MEKLRKFISSTPVIGDLARSLLKLLRRLKLVANAPYLIAEAESRVNDKLDKINSNRCSILPRFISFSRFNDKLDEINSNLRLAASVRDIEKLRRELLILQRKTDQLECGEKQPSSSLQPTRLPEGFYLAFENRFRGGFAAIQARQSIYLPIIQSAHAGTSSSPILDIGSGRGEWLQLLQHSGLAAYGVDSDASMVEACRELNLEAHLGDAFEHFGSLSENSLGSITGFHIAEHLPFAVLVNLCVEALRVLQPGGVLILETPTPENLLVGARYFYTDPTHQHSLPPDLLAFIAEYCGFSQVEIMHLPPFPQYDESLADSDRPERFIFGSQDYALIAHKAPDAP